MTGESVSGFWAAAVVVAAACAFADSVREAGRAPSATNANASAVEGAVSEVRKPAPKVEGPARARVCERLDRGLVALPVGGGKVYLSWRRLESDPPDLAFDVYRRSGRWRTVKLTEQPVVRTTDFIDAGAGGGTGCTWFVRAAGGAESPKVALAGARMAGEAVAYRSIPLRTRATFAKAAAGDLDGDGRMDFVIKQPGGSIDPYEKYWRRSSSAYTLEAYAADGRWLWKHDLGWAIEQGIWYSPYIVYDLDGDGRAEVIAKTGEGDPRDPDGRVQSGPEHVTVLDGRTGRVRARADWPGRDLFGDDPRAYNHAARNQLGVAYLDGRTPFLIVERGTYQRIVVDAYALEGRALRRAWRWDNGREPAVWQGQGAHELRAADVDGDGRDEVILGSCALDDTGDALWTTGLGHPDACYVGDLDPARPGLEIYYNIERAQAWSNGMCMAEARTGRLLWGHRGRTKHIHSQGLCGDILASSSGWECYGGERDDPLARWLRDCRGQVLSTNDLGALAMRSVYWDADAQRELVRGKRIGNYDPGQPAELPGEIEGDFVLAADLAGDWREEIVTSLPGELRIYSTLVPAADRRVCLLSDPIYRLDVVQASSGYYQVPMLSRPQP